MNPRPSPVAFRFEDLALGMTQVVDFQITQGDMEGFATLSGDYNPLHLDGDFARKKSFKGAVVYGGLLVAKVSQLIGMRLPGRDALWSHLELDFHRPLYVGEPARVTGVISELSDSTRVVVLELLIQSQGIRLAQGIAEVILG